MYGRSNLGTLASFKHRLLLSNLKFPHILTSFFLFSSSSLPHSFLILPPPFLFLSPHLLPPFLSLFSSLCPPLLFTSYSFPFNPSSYLLSPFLLPASFLIPIFLLLFPPTLSSSFFSPFFPPSILFDIYSLHSLCNIPWFCVSKIFQSLNFCKTAFTWAVDTCAV